MLRLNITMLIKVDCSLYCHYLARSLHLVTFVQCVSAYVHVCMWQMSVPAHVCTGAFCSFVQTYLVVGVRFSLDTMSCHSFALQ